MTKAKEIYSLFFQNIKNNKKDKIKDLLLNINEKKIQKDLNIIFSKWKYISQKYKDNNKEININSNFFDSCLSFNNEDAHKINMNEKNTITNDNSKNKDSNINFHEKNVINKNNLKISDEECNIANNIKNPEKSYYHDEIMHPKYDDKNNNSIILNKDISNGEKIKNNDSEIFDDFDIKINEEMIINSKDNSKRKSDIFDSYDINNNMNDNISNISPYKEINNISMKENENIIENKDYININNKSQMDINEICNLFNNENDTNNNFYKKNNNEIFNKEKNLLINGTEIIKNNSNKSRNDNSLKDIEKQSNLNIDEDNNNKNKFFDSLENNNFEINKTDYYINNKNENKNINNIKNNKIKILNQFLTLEKDSKKRFITPKKNKFQISETNNIILNKKNKEKNKDDPLYYTNQEKEKVENIFIKGEKKNYNKCQYNSENKCKKNLELFVIDKTDDIFIKHNTNNTHKYNKNTIIDNFNFILDNNLQERLIDTEMINNFLNNSKNEPMLPLHNYFNYSTIQVSNNNLNNKKKNDININSNFKVLRNFLNERKNNFYLKKALTNTTGTTGDNNNKKNLSKDVNSLNINEIELIEPNIQICPVSNSNIKKNNKEININ